MILFEKEVEEVTMQQKSLSMRKIEEILRLKYELGLTHRAIAKSCGVSTSTVSEYATHAIAGLGDRHPPELLIVFTGLRTKLTAHQIKLNTLNTIKAHRQVFSVMRTSMTNDCWGLVSRFKSAI